MSAHGRITFEDRLTYDISGSASNVNLAQLPQKLRLPRVPSDVSLEFTVAGSRAGVRGDVVLGRSRVDGAALARGTTVTFDTRGPALSLQAKGEVRHLELSRAGAMFDVEWLQTDRFQGVIDARFDVVVQGATLEAAKVLVSQGRLFGGDVSHLEMTARPAGSALAFAARGRFASIDFGVLAQRDGLDGQLTGTLDVTGAIPREQGRLVPARLDVAGHVLFDRVSIKGVAFQHGAIRAALNEGARLRIEQADLSSSTTIVQLTGIAGLEPHVPTNLRYNACSQSLAGLGAVVGAPLTGSAQLQGTVTGHNVFAIVGTASGANLDYRNVDAGPFTARYELALPRDNPAATDANAHVEIEQLTVAGQDLGAVDADLQYVDKRLTFDVDSTQMEGSVAAAGNILWHPDHQEVHIARLVVASPVGTWRLADGADAAIRYGQDLLSVTDLRLVAPPNQVIAAAGSVGDSAAPLRVTASDVDLSVLAPIIGEPTLQGLLQARATINGPFSAPAVVATFGVTAASVRGIAFQAVGGEVALGEDRLRGHVRLTHPDATSLAMEANVPATLLRGDNADTAPLQVTVSSSPMNLQVLGLLSDAVTDVTGTFQIDGSWEGSLAQPDLSGQLLIRDAAFAVPALGTRYTGVDTTVLFQPRNVVVEQVRVRDDDGDWLTIAGRLPVHELLAGKVTLTVNAESFELVDNAIADLEADLDLEVAGNLRLPDLTGTITLVNGEVHVDHVLALSAERRLESGGEARTSGLTPNPLAVRKENSLTTNAAARGLLSTVPIALDVRLRASDLLLEGRDLRAPGGGPIGLGNINITADGDLSLQKARSGPLRLLGEVEAVRGTYEFQNRDFELLRGGTIRFTGTTDLNPLFDITAERTISAVVARVHVGGSLADPTLRLSSNPPLDQVPAHHSPSRSVLWR